MHACVASATAASLSVTGTTQLTGSLQLGVNSVFTIGRTPVSTANAGQATYWLGQAAGAASCAGGDMVIDAGTGSLSGSVLLGPSARGVIVGAASTPVTVAGALTAGSTGTSSSHS